MAYWEDYEPFGDEWLQTVLLQIALLQPHTKHSLKVDDFYPFRGAKKQQTPEEIAAVFKAIGKQLESVNRGKHRQAGNRDRR